MTTAIIENPQVSLFEENRDLKVREELSDTDKKANQSTTDFLSQNPGWEILGLYLKKERATHIKIDKLTNEASQIQQTLQQLVELGGQLPSSENNKDVELYDKILSIFKDLEKANISLLKPDEKKLSPARMSEVKAQISAQKDRLNTELQIIISTKIQPQINLTHSLIETFRNTLDRQERMVSNAIRNQTKG